jgi:hypothetical protein
VLCSMGVYSDENSFIVPTSDFAANFCNFPQAWTVSKGKNVQVGVVYTEVEKKTNWVKAISGLAPESEVRRLNPADFLNSPAEAAKFHIILLLESIEDNDFARALNAIGVLTGKGSTVIIPAYFGPMKATRNYNAWSQFIADASQKGAVITGVHGRAYQLGALYFWKNVPADTFVLHTGVDGDDSFGYKALIRRDLESNAYIAAAAAALLKSKEPTLTPEQIKQAFRQKGRTVFWAYIIQKQEKGSPWKWVRPFLTRESVDKYIKKNPKDSVELQEIYEGTCLDAGLLLGIKPMASGEWSRSVLKVSEAQKMASGKGVTVAILDHMFDKEDPILKSRMVKPGSVLKGEPVFTESGHGTWMAWDLIKVAPDVKIMPVRMCGGDRFGDADLYIEGIRYAVKNGAKIISLSHQPIPENRQKDLDSAIEAASKKGVTFVYIHYQGTRKDVVVPCPIEFAPFDEDKQDIYMIGTNFVDESAFPYTWGVSPTAPMASGIIAMMLQINPKLTPLEIRDILSRSNNKTPDGYGLLDAKKAVSEAMKARK